MQRLAVAVLLFLASIPTAFAICNNCEPNPNDSAYSDTVAARPQTQNARNHVVNQDYDSMGQLSKVYDSDTPQNTFLNNFGNCFHGNPAETGMIIIRRTTARSRPSPTTPLPATIRVI
jgi:hypothetical protein